MGGGDHQQPQQPSPMEQAQAQIQIDNAKAARDKEAADRAAALKASQEAADRARTAQGVNSAYNAGLSFGKNKDAGLGFADTYGVLSNFNNALAGVRSSAPSVTDNPASLFNYQSLWDTAVNDATGAQRSKLDTAYRGATPVGWESNYWGDTSDDDILNAILGEQYGSAFDTVDAARARGQISQGAFDASLRGLNNQKEAAMSQLQDLGGTVLSGYRKNLDDISKGYSDQITNYKLGQSLNIDDMLAAFGQRQASDRGRLKGDIYRALGDTSLFNTDSVIAKGNAAAGVSNNPLRNAFRDSTTTDPERTTGTAGVF